MTADPLTPVHREQLDILLQNNLSERAFAWVQERSYQADNERSLAIAFSGCVRHCGKENLQVSAEIMGDIQDDWQPWTWLVCDAARARILISADPELIDSLFPTADLGELISLYRCLPLLAEPTRWVQRAAEATRSNATSVFTALAHSNPFPTRQLPEVNWNQMALKSLFIGASVDAIWQVDSRHNPALTRMLVDYARERRAASRNVPSALWRLAAPHLNAEEHADDVARTLSSDDACEALSLIKASNTNSWLTSLIATNDERIERARTTPWTELETTP